MILNLCKTEQEENRRTFIEGLVSSLQYNKVFCSQKSCPDYEIIS